MPRIPLKDCRPGQVLSRPVVNGHALVLLPSGTELSPSLIERLGAAGVETVEVSAGPADDASVEERLAALEKRFVGHETSALMMAIKAAAARAISGGGR